MVYCEKLSLERREEYNRRIAKIKKANPGVRFQSEYHNKMLDLNLAGIEDMDDLRRTFPIMSRIFCSEITKKQYAGQALAHAAAVGNLELCQRLCTETGAPLNMKDEEGHTALMNAVKRKRLGAAECLLKQGAKILSEKDGWNPVLEACASGCVPALNMFKHYGVDFNQQYVFWKKLGKFKPQKEVLSPLVVACTFRQPKVVQFLLDNGADIDLVGFQNCSVRDLVMLTPENLDETTRQILLKKVQETPQLNRRGSMSGATRCHQVLAR